MLDAIQSIAHAISGDVERFAKRSRRDAILFGLMVVFGGTAYAAAVTALAIYAAGQYGPVWGLFIVSLAAIFAMLVVIAIQQSAKARDRRIAAKAEARMRSISTLGAALLPLVLKSRAGSTAALVGGLAFVANEFLKSSSPPPAERHHSSGAPRRHMPPPPVNGAVNPYLQEKEQEFVR